MVKSFKQYLNESKVIVNTMSKSGNETKGFNNVNDAEKYVDSLNLDLRKDYFDIHTGSNTSEIQGLYKWGGVKGYWYNCLNDKDMKQSEKAKIQKLQLKEDEELTEVSEVDYDILVKDIDEKAQILKNEVDRITKRFHYRFITNISYNKKEATKITDEVWKEFEKAEKIISKCWGKIG